MALYFTESNITIDFINKHPEIEWDWYWISSNKNITMDDIINNPDKPWNKIGICYNPNITLEYIQSYDDDYWYWNILANNEKLSMDIIEHYSHKLTQYSYALSCNENISWDFIARNLDKKWDWDTIVRYSKINQEVIDKYPQFPFNFNTYDIIFNEYFTFDFIKKNLKTLYNSIGFSYYAKMEDIVNNPDIEWFYEYISENNNLTFEFINKNLDKGWDWCSISGNTFNYEKRYSELVKKHLAAFRIQSHWNRAIFDPDYKLCQDILERQYDQLYN